jgi:hypothetical protein
MGIFAITLTGLYLWWRFPSERRWGILFLVIGVIAFNIIIMFGLG